MTHKGILGHWDIGTLGHWDIGTGHWDIGTLGLDIVGHWWTLVDIGGHEGKGETF